MPQVFAYKARNLSGRLITGKIEGENQGAAVARLREKNIFVVSIKPLRSTGFDSGRFLGLKIKIRDMAIFCRQFSTMSEAGIPLLQCLSILVQQTENKNLRKIVQEVIVDIEKGKSMTEAFRIHRDRLPDLFISMLASGETSGTIDLALGRLATQFEKDHEVREKIKSAMTYPIVITGFALIAVITLIVVLVPIFVDIFSQMGAKLPLPTRILIFLSDGFIKYWYVLPLGLLTLFIALKKTIATPIGKKTVDWLLIKLPVVGKLIIKTITARFARTLSTLLRSGVPLIQSLETVERVVGNTIVAKELSDARGLVREGEKMAPIFIRGRFFPPMAVNMISVGEESGSLDSLLEKLAIFYEKEVDAMISRLSSIIEPLMIAGVGIMVAFIAISIYMPLFGMAGVLQGGIGAP